MRGIDKLKSGGWSYKGSTQQPDGSIKISLYKHGEGKVYKFRVKDLYGENEEVLEEEIIESGKGNL